MTKDELQAFCIDSRSDRASTLGRPYTRGAWTYACDGAICIRVPILSGVDDNPLAPNAEKLFTPIEEKTIWLPVPSAKMPPLVECEKCHGDGARECDMGYDHECDNCEGTGSVETRLSIEVGGVSFNQRYLALTKGWEIAPRGKQAALLRNGDYQGLLMPLRDPF